jgi:small subunit ribosomal protein S4
MARYTGANCKLCRREGKKLYLKGDKCASGKCPLEKRGTAPGQHGAARKKVEDYGRHLREKQTTRRYYGVLERQFRRYYNIAEAKDGMTGANLLVLLERRLDNVVFRMGMAASRKEARQLVLHGHFTVNGRKASVPSILLKAGDVVSVKENSRDSEKIKALAEGLGKQVTPKWLEVNASDLSAKLLTAPTREDIDFPFTEQLIVELYSK